MSICELILSQIENKNPKDDDGKTPLDWATESGHLEKYQEIMKLLKSKKPYFNLDYLTPMQRASKNYWDNHPWRYYRGIIE